ncbi:MAG: sulfotransferase family protein [Thainema sp.]
MANGSESSIQKRLFLVGCPRSGTTLLQSLLASHSQVQSFPESQFFLYLFSADKAQQFTDWPFETALTRPLFKLAARKLIFGMALARLRSHLRQFLQDINQPDLEQELPKAAIATKRQYTQAFFHVLDQVAQRQQQPIWLEKTPQHLYYLDYIVQQVPDAQFIHLARNGTDVVASLYDVRQRYPDQWPDEPADVKLCTARWLRDLRISLRYQGRPNHHFVRYEDLVANPAQVLETLCQRIGIVYESTMLDGYRETAQQVRLSSERWKTSVHQPIQNQNSTKFTQLFNADQRAYIENQVAKIDFTPFISQ